MSDADSGDNVPANAGDQVGAILFACNINAVRSAMAEAMVNMPFPARCLLIHAG